MIKILLFSLFSFYSFIGVSQAQYVVFVDSQYLNKDFLYTELNGNVSIVEISATDNPWKVLREYLESHKTVKTIHLFGNATYNSIQLGNEVYDLEKVSMENELSMMEGLYQGENFELLIYDCNLASNEDGQELLKAISMKSYINVLAPTKCQSIFDQNVGFDFYTLDQPNTTTIFN